MTSRYLDRKEYDVKPGECTVGLFLSFSWPVCADWVSSCPLDSLTYKNLIYLIILNLQFCVFLQPLQTFTCKLALSLLSLKSHLLWLRVLLFPTHPTPYPPHTIIYKSFSSQIGALAPHLRGDFNPHDGELTFMGEVLATLPVDIRLGKLMMLGHVFGMLEDTIIIGEECWQTTFICQ